MRRVLFLLFDVLLFYASIVFSSCVRFGYHSHKVDFTSVAWTLSAALLVFITYSLDLYDFSIQKTYSTIVMSTVLVNVLTFVIAMSICFWFRSFSTPRSIFMLAFLVNTVTQLVFRFLVFTATKQRTENVLVVADSIEDGFRIGYALKSSNSKMNVAYLTSESELGINELPKYNAVFMSDRVSPHWKNRTGQAALDAGITVNLVPESFDVISRPTKVSSYGDLMVFTSTPLYIPRRYRLVKRVMDLGCAIVLLLVASPAMIILSIVIPLESNGSAFYSQERVGLNGKIFRVHKFRSMRSDAEQKTGAILATANDPRITRIGRFIRATRLDELPQLFNVLIGDMSLVGPRPERPGFVKGFEEQIPGYGYRHIVKPGVTGYAQVSGFYTTDASDKLRYDLWYIRNYHPYQDVRLLLKTVIVVLTPHKARGVVLSGLDISDAMVAAAQEETLSEF